MAANGLSVERLQEYLQQLPPESRTLLIQRLEAAALARSRAARSCCRNCAACCVSPVTTRRVATLRSAISSDRSSPSWPMSIPPKLQGRIARASLDRLWTWICRDLVPAEAKDYCANSAVR